MKPKFKFKLTQDMKTYLFSMEDEFGKQQINFSAVRDKEQTAMMVNTILNLVNERYSHLLAGTAQQRHETISERFGPLRPYPAPMPKILPPLTITKQPSPNSGPLTQFVDWLTGADQIPAPVIESTTSTTSYTPSFKRKAIEIDLTASSSPEGTPEVSITAVKRPHLTPSEPVLLIEESKTASPSPAPRTPVVPRVEDLVEQTASPTPGVSRKRKFSKRAKQ